MKRYKAEDAQGDKVSVFSVPVETNDLGAAAYLSASDDGVYLTPNDLRALRDWCDGRVAELSRKAPTSTPVDEAKLEVLRIAAGAHDQPGTVVERAEAFERYLRGD